MDYEKFLEQRINIIKLRECMEIQKRNFNKVTLTKLEYQLLCEFYDLNFSPIPSTICGVPLVVCSE